MIQDQSGSGQRSPRKLKNTKLDCQRPANTAYEMSSFRKKKPTVALKRSPMHRQAIALACVTFCCLLVLPSFGQRKKKKDEEPLPLPPELPMVLAADTATLDFHISPLLKTGRLSAQIRQSLNDLLRDTRGETIVKLRAFVSGVGDARRVSAQVASLFTERKLPLPVVTVLQVGALGDESAQVVIEAVVATRRTVNPNGLAFFGGQTGPSFERALSHLQESAHAAGIAPGALLTCTCFTSRVDEYAAFRDAIQAAFPKAEIDVVQALRAPADESATCEAIGQLSASPKQALVLLQNSRAALVNSHQLVFTGLQLTFGSFLDDAREAFSRLGRAASSVGANAHDPVEIDAFSLDPYSGSAVRKIAGVPPSTLSIQTVEGLPSLDASAGIEAVFAPNVSSPVTVSQ